MPQEDELDKGWRKARKLTQHRLGVHANACDRYADLEKKLKTLTALVELTRADIESRTQLVDEARAAESVLVQRIAERDDQVDSSDAEDVQQELPTDGSGDHVRFVPLSA